MLHQLVSQNPQNKSSQRHGVLQCWPIIAPNASIHQSPDLLYQDFKNILYEEVALPKISSLQSLPLNLLIIFPCFLLLLLRYSNIGSQHEVFSSDTIQCCARLG
jgi:hypothetical protein